MNTKEVADQLVAFCREGKWEDAQHKLYADNAVSIEPMASPAFAKETKGLKAILEKGRKFSSMLEKVHSLNVSDPLVAKDSFTCLMTMDMTMKGQPRQTMSEICVYEVKDGKIVSEQFHL